MRKPRLLEVDRVRASYGAAPAITDISLEIETGELVVVVGPNGAGKSTLINAIAGLHRIEAGALRFEGRDISRVPAHAFCDEGIAIVPEGRRLFTGMSVEDNLALGSYRTAARANRTQNLERVFTLFPILRERRNALSGSLSGGQQQMVAIGRALMCEPKLLLLDEPSLGLAPMIVEQMFDIIRTVHQGGIAVLLVEQNVAMALKLAERAYVLEEGHVVAEGSPENLLADPAIRRAYLGAA